jgi:hypothetical protein
MVVSLAGLALAGPAVGATVVDTVLRPTPVSAFQGRAVWSRFDPATGRYQLVTATAADPRPAVLPIPSRAVPFDADLGPGPGGSTVAVYSRCAREPFGAGPDGMPVWSTGRGCDIYVFDFADPQEVRYGAGNTRDASEFLPSIWGTRIAFARRYERRTGRRGIYPYVYVVPIPGDPSERLPGGSRGVTGRPGPFGLDLAGRSLALGWRYVRGGEGRPVRSEVRLDVVGAGHRMIDGTTSASVRRFLTAPEISEGKIGFARMFGNVGHRNTCSGLSQAELDEAGPSCFRLYRISRERITGSSVIRERVLGTTLDYGPLPMGRREPGFAVRLEALRYGDTPASYCALAASPLAEPCRIVLP